MENKKKFTLLGLSTACLGLVFGAISFEGGYLFKINANQDYDIVFNGTNGNATASTLKTTVGVAAKTALDNNTSVSYKNMEVVAGKVGKIKAGGWYANYDAICGMASITVVSDAVAGDATLKFGLTSAVLDGEVDLALASGVVVGGANFFKIVAKNDVTITSVSINFTCDASENGLSFKNGNDEIAHPVDLVKVGQTYEIRRTGGSGVSSQATTRAVLPDFAGTGDDFGYCTSIPVVSNYGLFEATTGLQEVYIPDRITTFGNYIFNATSKVKEFTLPYALATFGSYSVPKGDLEVLNINSVHPTGNNTCISSSDQPKLKTINVSYDVEVLPSIVSSWPSTGVRVNYEGTEAEWAIVTGASQAKWTDSALDVYCSDTVLSNITLHYSDSTFNGDSSGTYVIKEKIGKSFANPGKPVYNGGENKVFSGWYTAAEGGEKVSFPFEVTGNKDLYAQFIDNPGGDTKETAREVTAGNSYDFETDDGIKRYYFSITSDVDKVVEFSVSNIEKTGGSYSERRDSWKAWSVKDSTYTEETISGTSASVENQIAKVGISSTNNIGPVRVRLSAGEKFVLGLDFCDYGANTYYASATLTVSEITEARVDYTTAASFDIGDVVEDNTNSTFRYFKFTPSATGTYTFIGGKLNETSTRWCSFNCFHFDEDGKAIYDFTSFSATGGSYSKRNVQLTAGVDYYVAVSSNSTGSDFFQITSGLTSGLDFDNPIELTIGAAPTSVTYNGSSCNYYSFTIATAGNYIVRFSGSSFPTVYKSDKTKTVSMTKIDTNNKYAAFEPGTYYIKVSISASYTYNLDVREAIAGSLKEFAISATYDPTAFTFDAATDGKWYKMTPNESKKYNITAPAGVEVKFVVGSTTTTIAAGQSKLFAFTNNSTTYVCLTGSAGTYTLETEEFASPLKDLTFLNVQFNGTRNGSSYYKMFFVADGYTWEGNSTVYDASNITNVDGILTFEANNKKIYTNGNEAFVYSTASETYFLSKRNTAYSSGAYNATYYATSGLTTTSGLVYNKMKLDGDVYTEFVMIDGEVFFDIEITLTEGSSISNNCTFTFVANSKTVQITVFEGEATKTIVG